MRIVVLYRRPLLSSSHHNHSQRVARCHTPSTAEHTSPHHLTLLVAAVVISVPICEA